MKNQKRTNNTVRAAIAGDLDALEHILKFCYQVEHARLCRYGIPRMTAEEIASDLMIPVWRNVSESKLDPETDLEAWCYVVSKNLLHDHFRREKRRVARFSSLSDEFVASEPQQLRVESEAEERLMSKDRQDLIWEVVNMLPELERDLVERRYRQKQSHREITDELGMSEGAVRTRLWRARHKLRSLLGCYHVETF